MLFNLYIHIYIYIKFSVKGNFIIMNLQAIRTNIFFFLLWRCDSRRVMASSFLRFLDHIQRRTTVGRTPLDEWSARRRDIYLTTHDIHNRQISLPPVVFEPTISVGERPQTYALDRAATESGYVQISSFGISHQEAETHLPDNQLSGWMITYLWQFKHEQKCDN